jgi:hypothetical protein|tara:strand:- start:1374 stop:1769 length:396 start_codon:yes stop_codon:yes gene_type:complete
MAHFAKIGLDNKVTRVHVVSNGVLKDAYGNTEELLGVQFLTKIHGWSLWKQTSYNTWKGTHKLGGTPFRKNYAGKGFTYDEDRDAFIPPQKFPSWILDEDTCVYEAPVAMPDDGKLYNWNEETTSWDLVHK